MCQPNMREMHTSDQVTSFRWPQPSRCTQPLPPSSCHKQDAPLQGLIILLLFLFRRRLASDDLEHGLAQARLHVRNGWASPGSRADKRIGGRCTRSPAPAHLLCGCLRHRCSCPAGQWLCRAAARIACCSPSVYRCRYVTSPLQTSIEPKSGKGTRPKLCGTQTPGHLPISA